MLIDELENIVNVSSASLVFRPYRNSHLQHLGIMSCKVKVGLIKFLLSFLCMTIDCVQIRLCAQVKASLQTSHTFPPVCLLGHTGDSLCAPTCGCVLAWFLYVH